MLNGRNFNVDENHSEVPAGPAVVESALDAKGAWNVVIKMDPASDTFQKVKTGEYQGLSMMALCSKKEEEPPNAESPEIAALKAQIAKQAKELEELSQVVKTLPKSRQLIVDSAGNVSISKNEAPDPATLSEFDFAKLT